ncbi:hypothetical protein HS7_05290 [Sulfolobales archaeon HS-7]|nr:hypothetical protein HS7_05290 [Sulfolobales archaeon HS-7]
MRSSLFSKLDEKAPVPLEIRAAYYPPIYTGIRAYTLQEFIEGLKKANGLSIFYHVFHPVFTSHIIPDDLHNDFAFWFRTQLEEEDIADMVSDISGGEPRTVEDVRKDIINILSQFSASRVARYPFSFLSCTPIVYDTGIRVETPGQLLDSVSTMTARGLVYHFVFRRVMGYTTKNDFSNWLESMGLNGPANELSKIDPQTYTDETKLRRDILLVLERWFL